LLNANCKLRWKLAIKLERYRPRDWQVCNPATQNRIGQLICGIRCISRAVDTQLRGLEQRLIFARCPQGFFIANRLREHDLRGQECGGKNATYGPFHGNFSLDVRDAQFHQSIDVISDHRCPMDAYERGAWRP
jgi:hypothetical protein